MELTSMDLHFVVEELQVLVGGKIDKIYQREKKVVFQTHVTGKGKSFLNVVLPSTLFLSEEKESYEESGKFALSLRKHLSQARIAEISQVDFERIVRIKVAPYTLYIELFRPGNIILTDEELKIKMALTYKGFGSRLIRPGINYVHPTRPNALAISKEDLEKVLKSSEKSSIVISLATDLGFGGKYAEWILENAGIDKHDANISDAGKIHEGIQKLLRSSKNVLKAIDPDACSFSEAFSKDIPLVKEDKDLKKRQEVQRIIENLEAQIKGYEVSAAENQKKGEMIYENYTAVEKQINAALKAGKKGNIQVEL